MFLTLTSFAHQELEPKITQENSYLSVWLPFYVSLNGEVSFLKNHTADAFVFSPLLNISASIKKSHYINPTRINEFSLELSEGNSQWLEVHQRNLQAGLGIGVLKNKMTLGLFPFKGASQRLVKVSSSKVIKTQPLSLLPKELTQLAAWSIGDYGSFDTYGGLELQASASLGIIDLASAKFILQNEFKLDIKKISADEITLAIYEGSSKRRRLSVGPILANVTLANFSGKRLGAEFLLDLRIEEHHQLFAAALKGDIYRLQQSLPFTAQKVSWQGNAISSFLGIPLLVGRDTRKGKVELEENAKQTTIYFKSKKNAGFILPRRDIHRVLYFTQREMVLFWSSEMKGVKGNTLEKHFLSIGRRLGLSGFGPQVAADLKIGTTLGQLGISLTKEELSLLIGNDLIILNAHYQQRCLALNLACKKNTKRQQTLKAFQFSLQQGWSQGRAQLGELLVKNPALIHSIVKTLRLKKKGYFYFLSEKFRSAEGMSEIAF